VPPSTQACARAGSGHRGMTLPLGTRRSVRRMLNGLLGSSRGRVNETAGRQSGICSLRIFSRGRPPFFPSVTGMQRATAEPLCRGRGPDTFADACVTSAEGSSADSFQHSARVVLGGRASLSGSGVAAYLMGRVSCGLMRRVKETPFPIMGAPRVALGDAQLWFWCLRHVLDWADLARTHAPE